MVATVVLDIYTKKINRLYDYLIPTKFLKVLKIGMRVIVNFNGQNRLAYVVFLKDFSSYANKEVLYLLDDKPLISKTLFMLIEKIRKESFSSYVESFKTVIPKSLLTFNEYTFNVNVNNNLPLSVLKHVKNGKVNLKHFEKQDFSQLKTYLKNKDLIKPVKKVKPYKQSFSLAEDLVFLTEDQKEVISKVSLNKYARYLLFGPKASGKTEIYLRLAEQVLKAGKQVLILVSEVSAIYQMVNRLQRRLGLEIGVFHSYLKPKQRIGIYNQVLSDKIQVVVGTRSALFMPLAKLGMIVLDEAHSDSYIQKEKPYYNTIDLASFLGNIKKAPVIYGSSTPTVNMIYDCDLGKMKLLKLDKSIVENKVKINLVDMKKELIKGNLSIISHELKDSIRKTLNKKEQIILLINRRGYAPFLLCRSCGYVPKCPNCQINLVYHKKKAVLKCHHCGYQEKLTTVCPLCGFNNIKPIGFGIEQVIEVLKDEFKDIKIVQVDQDTLKEEKIDEALSLFASKQADLLIGTEMISKSHHFENVSLVGILLADQALSLSGLLTNEKAYNLFKQHIGRIRKLDGKAIIQAYDINHFVLKSIVKDDFNLYYQRELEYRKLNKLPPFYNIMKITFKGLDEKKTFNSLMALKRSILAKNTQLEILGPTERYLFFVDSSYSYSLLIKAPKSYNLDLLGQYFEKRFNKFYVTHIDKYPNYV